MDCVIVYYLTIIMFQGNYGNDRKKQTNAAEIKQAFCDGRGSMAFKVKSCESIYLKLSVLLTNLLLNTNNKFSLYDTSYSERCVQ